MAKRLQDLLLALIALFVLAPVFVLLYVSVLCVFGSPVLFTQMRVGAGCSTFKLYKFRSMTDDRDLDGELLPDSQRIGRFGLLLRSTSLDELPSLFNVLKGDMSIVGPRPLLVEYLPLYSREQIRRHEVKPGITGLAQISGRNTLSWKDKFEIDVFYVDTRSFWSDCRIIMITLFKVVKREGINAKGEVAMAKFTGSEE
jgi:sugar transferase EpsL